MSGSPIWLGGFGNSENCGLGYPVWGPVREPPGGKDGGGASAPSAPRATLPAFVARSGPIGRSEQHREQENPNGHIANVSTRSDLQGK